MLANMGADIDGTRLTKMIIDLFHSSFQDSGNFFPKNAVKKSDQMTDLGDRMKILDNGSPNYR